METAGYVFLGIVAIIYAGVIFFGLIAVFPWGIIGFIAIIGMGFLFAKVVSERLQNTEDDHYSRTVEK
jgi:hypothetical protein